MHTNILTYRQPRKEIFKKESKIVFKHTDLQTFKHLLCKRERQKRSKKYHARTRFVENNYSCNQTFKLACFEDNK